MRYPAVSGTFYPSSASQLRAQVQGWLSDAAEEVERKRRLAIICPHAGYVYSGKCAAYSFASCDNWKGKGLTAVIIGPNHTGAGMPVAVSFEDWKTPLGEIKCDTALADYITKSGKAPKRDESAHMNEHSSEVQVPFLQACAPDAKMVGICMGWQDIVAAKDLGKAIFDAAQKAKRDVIVIASSDFTHYEPAAQAKEKDMRAIGKLLELDEDGFDDVVEGEGLTICGHGPIAAALHYAKLAGAKKCELLKYTNSGEATGDDGNVVAYAGLAIGR